MIQKNVVVINTEVVVLTGGRMVGWGRMGGVGVGMRGVGA